MLSRLWRIIVLRLKGGSRVSPWAQERRVEPRFGDDHRHAIVQSILRGRCWVIDGDTIVINDVRIRLAGIDAPELDHPHGKQSKWALVRLCKGRTITAHILPELSYDRVVAQCFLPDGRDIAAELVRCGLAIDWPKFSGGKYTHLEQPDARRKLWRADARQKGRLRL
ncbi:hypothetical protein GCM10007989_13970 [Devosia pacifica]|uniref:TNase-like domain-containing protein n=1 Tax=Devosia pacifica TaxID=1335967 RepID=A0A918S287_9HYPH|nr:hypothetical protein GCM10007989_13970 [Devosia pacifica]